MSNIFHQSLTDSKPNHDECFTEQEIKLAVDVMQLILDWKNGLEINFQCDKEVA